MKYLFVTLLLFAGAAIGQVSEPRHQSAFKHLFHPHLNADLEARAKQLSCAIAFITTSSGSGTGFFISEDGDLITAAHVVSARTFAVLNNQLQSNVMIMPNISVRTSTNQKIPIPFDKVQRNDTIYARDMIKLKTGYKTSCFLRVEKSDVVIGEHVIAIGFPGIDSGSPALYDGFVSAMHPHPPVPLGRVGNISVMADYDVVKVQMPVTPGSSGSPVIDDRNRVIGIISEVPVVWTDDLNRLVQALQQGHLAGGVSIGNSEQSFDILQLIGQLGWVLHEFESPGTGFAVPMKYLSGPEPEQGPPISSSAHGK